MLTRVLLHVVEPAGPFDLPMNRRANGYRAAQHVDDLVTLVDRVDDGN